MTEMTQDRMDYLVGKSRFAVEQASALDVANGFLGDAIGVRIRAALSPEDQAVFVWNILGQLDESVKGSVWDLEIQDDEVSA